MPLSPITKHIVASILFALCLGVNAPMATPSPKPPALMRPSLDFEQVVLVNGYKGWAIDERHYAPLIQYIVGLEHEYRRCRGKQ